jgi:alkaline phosphatase
VLKAAPTFVVNEDGAGHSAFWMRDVTLPVPGQYKVEARHGDAKAEVRWEVYNTPAAKAKNVILFVGDGLSNAHRVAARMLAKGIAQGRYGGELAMDDMPHMALVSTAGTDSIITDSANSASAYTTGHKSCNNALGVYCARNKDNGAHPKVETISSLARRLKAMSIGIVTNTEVQDATPAAMVAHTRRRADYDRITEMLLEAQPEVILGGGSASFLPAPRGRRQDNMDVLVKFETAGYKLVANRTDMTAAAKDAGTTRLLGLFNTGNMDGVLDRRFLKKGTTERFPDQPDLVEEVEAALAVLSRGDKGFVLMVESGLIDKYAHALDWERSVYDTIMLDNAVKVAKAWAEPRNDTLILVVADHTHPVSIIGTYDDARQGATLRDKLGTYAAAGFPNYPTAGEGGYPSNVDVSRRLAFVFSAYPDHCDAGRPSLANPNKPGDEAVCGLAGAARRVGNLPLNATAGVHSGDDVLLTAMGPGAELVRGRLDNTAVFRVMATALGLGAVD